MKQEKILAQCRYDMGSVNSEFFFRLIHALQIPATWRPMFEDENFVNTLFSAYREFQPPLSAKVKKQNAEMFNAVW